MRSWIIFWAVVSIAVGVESIQLPNITGPFPVGTVALELVDHARVDPLAPHPQPRALMISLFYPTSKAAVSSGNFSYASYFTPQTSVFFDSYFGLPVRTGESIVTQSYLGAPIANPDFPVLIFGHGFGGSRLIYAAQIEDLASHGWIVVAVDHTYEALVVEFPGGSLIPGLPLNSSDFPGGTEGILKVRVEDVAFVAKSLEDPTILAQIPGLEYACGGTRKLQTDKVGIFGHSFGGATAAQAMLDHNVFACGANFDGSVHGPVTKAGLDKPFLLMAAHGHNRTNDATWAEFWHNPSESSRYFQVNGTVHMSFVDIPIILDLFGGVFPPEVRDQFGSIVGTRVLEIETAFMDAFFGFCLKDQPLHELDSLVGNRFAEVSVGY